MQTESNTKTKLNEMSNHFHYRDIIQIQLFKTEQPHHNAIKSSCWFHSYFFNNLFIQQIL